MKTDFYFCKPLSIISDISKSFLNQKLVACTCTCKFFLHKNVLNFHCMTHRNKEIKNKRNKEVKFYVILFKKTHVSTIPFAYKMYN